jgi:hypothetical protein
MVLVVNNPAAPTHRVFEVHSRGDCDEIRRTPRLVRFEIGSGTANGPGDNYRVRAGDFHLSVPPDSEVATLVLANSLPGAIDLALGAIHTSTHLVRRESYDLAETRRLARNVADHCALKISPRSGDLWRPR